MILRPTSLNQAVGTLLGATKGPIALRNWFNTTTNPTYNVIISSGATGQVELQGTNNVYLLTDQAENNAAVGFDLLPTEASSWATIATFSAGATIGTFNTSYQYIQFIISTQGTGTIGPAFVLWN